MEINFRFKTGNKLKYKIILIHIRFIFYLNKLIKNIREVTLKFLIKDFFRNPTGTQFNVGEPVPAPALALTLALYIFLYRFDSLEMAWLRLPNTGS